MESGQFRKPDLWSGLFLFLLGLGLSFFSWRIGLGVLSKPGPGFMPFLVGLVLASLSLGLLVQVLYQKTGAWWSIHLPWRSVLWVGVLMGGYGFFLEKIGLIAVTFLFIALTLKFVSSGGWAKALIGGALSSLASYLLFVYLLKIQIPSGFGPFF